MIYTYYTTQRPATPGAIPMQGLINIKNYDTKKQLEYCTAYSQLTYSRELTEQELDSYELSDNTPTYTPFMAHLPSRCVVYKLSNFANSTE